MDVVVVLIAASLLVAVAFLIAFLWAVKSGQYEDRYTPSVRILFDDEKLNTSGKDKSQINLNKKPEEEKNEKI